MKIGLDLDGVVVAWHEHFTEFLNHRYNLNLDFKDWTDYGFTNSGLPLCKIQELVQVQSYYHGFLLPKPIPDAIETLDKLKDKHTFHVITNRKLNARQDAVEWLDKKGVSYDSISFTKNKARICYLLGLDLMIDDELSNVERVAITGVECLLYNRPYNQTKDLNRLITRVNSWKEIYNILK